MRLRSYRINIHFPLELIGHIIDHLHDCPSSLRSCALVCRGWVSSSRFHLFHRIVIHASRRDHNVTYSCGKLLGILLKSPDIAFCIRELHISGGVYRDIDWYSLNTMPHILGRLTRLRRLQLDRIWWSALTPDIRASFHALFALPSLVDIETTLLVVSKLEDFTNMLCFPLRRLTVSFQYDRSPYYATATRTIDEEDREMQQKKPCQLEYLQLNKDRGEDSPPFIHWLLGSQTVIDISNLRTLDARCHTKNGENDTTRLLRRLGSSLENLTIRHPLVKNWDADSLDVGCNPNIQSLTLVVRHEVHLVPYLKRFLPRLTAPNIQRFFLEIRSLTYNEAMYETGWDEIDQILAGVKFGSLKEVRLYLTVKHPGSNTVRVFRCLVAQFPLLDAKGIFHVERKYPYPEGPFD